MTRVVLLRSNPVSPDPPVEKMANTLVELGYQVIVVGWDRVNNYTKQSGDLALKNGKCQIIRFGIKASFGSGFHGNLRPLLSFQRQLNKWLVDNREQYDVIHAFDFDTGFIASCAAKRFKKKLVYHILDYYVDAHNIGNSLLCKLVKTEENNVIAKADATIICTEKRKEQISGSKPKKLYIIHNTPDSKMIGTGSRMIKTMNVNKAKIVYVGILAPSRMLLELIEIASLDQNIEVHIGGFGKLAERIEESAEKTSNIHYYGKLPYDAALELENECDIMIATYNPEIRNNQFAAPNKFYEAMMLGKPIIMSKNTGFDQIIEENSIGQTIDFSKEGLKIGIVNLLSQRDRWEEMARVEKALYQSQYSWQLMKSRIKELYSTL